MIAFTPLENFDCPDLKSTYLVGLSYTARDPNEPGIPERTAQGRAKLIENLPRWLEEKKVRLGLPIVAGVEQAAASVTGVGEVSDTPPA